MRMLLALVIGLFCNPFVEPFPWFGTEKKKIIKSSESTRDKLMNVLSSYNISTDKNRENSIPLGLKKQADKWRTYKKIQKQEAKDNDLPSNPKIRKFSSRRPMDGASFTMLESIVKSEVIATEEENSRLEQERERVVAAMAAKQELKERQEAQDQQDALTPEHHQEQHQELALAQQLSVQEHELAKLPQHGGVDTGPDVYKEPVEEGEPDLLAHPKKIDFSQRLRLKSSASRSNGVKRKGHVKVLTSAKKRGRSGAPSAGMTRHDTLVFSRKTWCQNARKDYNIESHVSFGTATGAAQTIWRDYKCNKLLESKLTSLGPIADCAEASGATRLVRDAEEAAYPLIAIMVAVSTRGVSKPSLRDLDLFSVSMPSLMSSLDCGFRYVVVLGFDRGDQFFGKEKGMTEVKTWFQKDVIAPLEKHGLSMRLETVAVGHAALSPGTVVASVALRAMTLGAEFLYRVSDDSEFRERWPAVFSAAVRSLQSPPLLGVVGPVVSGEDRTAVLRHDFVHRTHMDIFAPHYYPQALAEVHMDRWMSRVYGHNRTFVTSGVSIIKRSDGPVQAVNSFIPDERVTDLVVIGKQQILSWVKKNSSLRDAMSSMVAEFESPFASLRKRLKSFPADPDAAEDDELLDDLIRDKHSPSKNAKSHSDRQKWCIKTKRLYDVKPYLDWGTNISDDQKSIWKDYACNMFFIAKKLNKRGVSQCGGGDNLNRSLAGDFPLIAVLAATTTRKIVDPSVSNIALFTILLPSLVRSLDCGFRYMYVMGYDSGDKFFDTKKGMVKTLAYFNTHVHEKMRTHGILVTLQLVKVHNTLHKPGPVFNEMGKAAFAAGADYFYRVNDDTEFLQPWAKAYTTALGRLSKPFGVIGPYSVHTSKTAARAQNRILTHDFVHRTHMEIFSMQYYPPELVDWWMDDWISHVYGRARTFISHDCAVMHHTTTHGKRYLVDFDNEKHLSPLIKSGRHKILDWMVQNEGQLQRGALKDFSRTYKDYSSYEFRDIGDMAK